MLGTITYHVPRNEALAKLEPTSGGAAGQWARYLADWTTWNHVRAAAAPVACGLQIGAIHAA